MRNTPNLIQGLAALMVMCVLYLPTFATPITYGFDATITNVPTGIPFELLLSFSVGDTVSGRFTFEPEIGNETEVRREYVQSGDLLVVVDGVEFVSSAYSIEVHNNEAFVDAPFESADLIEVGCSRPGLSTACVPEVIHLGAGEPFRFRALLRVLGKTDLLSDTSIPTDVNVWNALNTERILQVRYDSLGPGSLGFDGRLSNLWVIPEPSCWILFITVAAAGLMYYGRNSARLKKPTAD